MIEVKGNGRIILTSLKLNFTKRTSRHRWSLPREGFVILTNDDMGSILSSETKRHFVIGIETKNQNWNSRLQVFYFII